MIRFPSKGVILARFVDFDFILTNPLAIGCQIYQNILIFLKNSVKINFSNYLPQFRISLLLSY